MKRTPWVVAVAAACALALFNFSAQPLQASEAKLKHDSQGRVESTEFAQKTRTFSFRNNKGRAIASVTIEDRSAGTVKTFTYTGQSDERGEEWRITDRLGNQVGSWRGWLHLSSEGVYSYREGFNGKSPPSETWTSFDLNGGQFSEYITDNETHIRLDDQNRVWTVTRSDGSRVEAIYKDGQRSEVIEQPSEGKRTVWKPQGKNKWVVSEGKPAATRLDLQLDRFGNLDYRTDDGLRHTLANDGKHYLNNTDGSTVELNSTGLCVKARSLAGVRSFQYKDKTLVSFETVTADGTKTSWQSKGRSQVSISPTGDVSYDEDDRRVCERTDLSKQVRDKDGKLLLVESGQGKRQFTYESAKLVSVRDSWQSSGARKHKTWKTWERISKDGDVVHKDAAGKEHTSFVFHLALPRRTDAAAVQQAHERLLECLDSRLPRKRLLRLEKNMCAFEARMADLALMQSVAGVDEDAARQQCQTSVSAAFDHLRQMVEAGGDAFFKEERRVMLAETFVFHAGDPSASDQGFTGSCWIHSGHICTMINHPDCLARLVRQVAVKGSYTTLNGGQYGGLVRTITFSSDLFNGMDSGPEAHWDMELARLDGNVRSPVGLLLDQTLPVIGGRPEGKSDMGQFFGPGGARDIIYMVTGDTLYDELNLINGNERETLLRNGAVVTYAPHHMRTRQLRRDADGWYLLQDDQTGDGRDQVIERIKDLKQWLKAAPVRL